MRESDGVIRAVEVDVHRIPTPYPEADGTLTWNETTIIVVSVHCGGGVSGLGWTYANSACAPLIQEVLAPVVTGLTVLDTPACWHVMQRQIRNLGRPGLVSCAMSAVDIAVWDAAARLLTLPVSRLLGRIHGTAEVYGSGGFTSQDNSQLTEQLQSWVHDKGIPRVKMKIAESWGTQLKRDLARVNLARRVVGKNVEIYVDANGGYSVGQARRVGQWLADCEVTWFEEPVSSDDLTGLRTVRDTVTADVAAGEYGYDLPYFTRLIEAQAVDCVQIDVTRCGGYTEWLRIAALAAAHNLDVSSHGAPNLSAHVAVATPNFRHIEWFADHERIESTLFDGVLTPDDGRLRPSTSVAGTGMTWR